jgi:hypothetical protein
MPFEQLTPRRFTSTSIQTYAPVASGVYGISNASEWIYIGETDNIQAALMDHLQYLYTSLMQREPTGFVFEICEGARRSARQGRLVHEYEPSCNEGASQHRAWEGA